MKTKKITTPANTGNAPHLRVIHNQRQELETLRAQLAASKRAQTIKDLEQAAKMANNRHALEYNRAEALKKELSEAEADLKELDRAQARAERLLNDAGIPYADTIDLRLAYLFARLAKGVFSS